MLQPEKKICSLNQGWGMTMHACAGGDAKATALGKSMSQKFSQAMPGQLIGLTLTQVRAVQALMCDESVYVWVCVRARGGLRA